MEVIAYKGEDAVNGLWAVAGDVLKLITVGEEDLSPGHVGAVPFDEGTGIESGVAGYVRDPGIFLFFEEVVHGILVFSSNIRSRAAVVYPLECITDTFIV